MKLKQLPLSERPRERLFREGATALSLAELIAILLRTGSGNKDVLGLSGELLHLFGGLKGISKASISEILQVKGMGKAKVAVLVAALELGKRLMACDTNIESERDEWRKTLSYLCRLLSEEEREIIVSLFLDRKGGVISKERVSYGGIEGAFLDVKYLFRKAVRLDARGMVLIHNHPNGTLRPSREDIMLTEFVERSLSVLDISFVGHFIAARGEWVQIPPGYTA